MLTPAERVTRLRRRLGLSLDNFAKRLVEKGAEQGLDLKANRQLVIRWESGANGIGPDYARVLAALDSSKAEGFRPPRAAQQFRAVAARVKAIDERLARLEESLERAGLLPPGSSQDGAQ